jgi:DNA-binding ferritin-like protein
MFVSNGYTAARRCAGRPATAGLGASWKLRMLLDEVLAHSLELRGRYQNARWQSSGIEDRQLRLVFDDHYKEQRRLIDVLAGRVRMLGGAGRIFAGDIPATDSLPGELPSRQAQSGLLCDLLDAHEMILSVARRNDSASVRDFAVGQVVLVNEVQSRSIGELLVGRSDDPRMSMPAALYLD